MNKADWKTLSLGKVLTFQRGFDITKDEQREGPYFVISSSGPKSTHLDFKVEGPGVIIGRKGSLGTVFFSASDFWPHDTTLWVKDFHGNDPRFAFYFLQTMGFERLDAGASNPSLNRNHIHTLPVYWPTVSIQKQIASILSSYDELIENCHRRIQILEEMARALYREWFIEFRFPGHEAMARVASPLGDIPEGWEVKPVSESFVILGGGTPSRAESSFWDEGAIQWYSPSDLTGAGTMFIEDSGDHITDRGLAGSSAKLFPARSVMLTSRATIGAIAINTYEASTNQGFITCLPNNRVPLVFLYHWLKDNVPTFQRMASGATFKEISRGVFKTIDFLLPPEIIVSKFEALASPMTDQILAAQRQVRNLRQSRDLLLPRLLSGEIELVTVEAEATPSSNIIPFPVKADVKSKREAPDEFKEAVLIAEVVRRFSSPQYPLGRMRYNKFSYLAHRKVEDDVQRHYLKQAAGPYSPWAKYQGPEGIAIRSGYIVFVKVWQYEGFLPGPKIGEIDQYLSHYPSCGALDWVAENFRYKKKDELELLTTVDFAVMDLQQSNQPVSAGNVRQVIAANPKWAPKLDRSVFSDENISKALGELGNWFPVLYGAQVA